MHRSVRGAAAALTLLLASVTAAAAQQHSGHPAHAVQPGAPADSAFAQVQERGRAAMGVDQYTSRHLFDTLEDGGRIELQRAVDDSAGVAVIRAHLRDIAQRFAAGDFAIPGFVHAREVPGAAVMAARKDAIRYTFRELPRGGEVRITTADAAALRAIQAFMAFQRSDHRAGGHH